MIMNATFVNYRKFELPGILNGKSTHRKGFWITRYFESEINGFEGFWISKDVDWKVDELHRIFNYKWFWMENLWITKDFEIKKGFRLEVDELNWQGFWMKHQRITKDFELQRILYGNQRITKDSELQWILNGKSMSSIRFWITKDIEWKINELQRILKYEGFWMENRWSAKDFQLQRILNGKSINYKGFGIAKHFERKICELQRTLNYKAFW